MTQLFTYQGFSFRAAPFHLRLLVTSFIAMAALGVTVGFANYQVRTGLAAQGSAAWYRQGRAWVDSAQSGEGVGLYAKTPLELLDASHPHLFNQAFLFFVLGHLLALCAMPARRKNAVVLAGFGGVLIDVASPWLIRYGHPGFAWLQLVGHVLMLGAFAALVFVPLREMWWRRARAGGAAAALALALLAGGCSPADVTAQIAVPAEVLEPAESDLELSARATPRSAPAARRGSSP